MAPYYLNSWYCVGWSKDLTDKPSGITICGKTLALYRDPAGSAVALDGRCPHRFAPLAKGVVVGDRLQCPYHGLLFDRTGACVHNPHGDGMIPPNARVGSYPVQERAGALWVWPGDPEKADVDLLPSTDWLVNDAYATATGYLLVNADYQLVTDNLLDLTHAPYLHPGTVGGRPEDSIGQVMEHSFETTDGNVIHSNYRVRNMPRPTPQLLPLWGERSGDFYAEMRWQPASSMELDIFITEPGEDKKAGVHVPTLHYLTPTGDGATHYFFAIGRNVMIDDDEQTRLMAHFARIAFEEEDEPMIRACQDLMGTSDLMSLRPAILRTDVAGVQARRVLGKLMKAETAVA